MQHMHNDMIWKGKLGPAAKATSHRAHASTTPRKWERAPCNRSTPPAAATHLFQYKRLKGAVQPLAIKYEGRSDGMRLQERGGGAKRTWERGWVRVAAPVAPKHQSKHQHGARCLVVLLNSKFGAERIFSMIDDNVLGVKLKITARCHIAVRNEHAPLQLAGTPLAMSWRIPIDAAMIVEGMTSRGRWGEGCSPWLCG